jgi:hypothetical protein
MSTEYLKTNTILSAELEIVREESRIAATQADNLQKNKQKLEDQFNYTITKMQQMFPQVQNFYQLPEKQKIKMIQASDRQIAEQQNSRHK